MPSNTQNAPSQVAQFSSNVVMFDGRGVAKEIPINGVTNVDMRVPDDSMLTGGSLNVRGATTGDFCDLQVVDLDQVLRGVMSPYGVTWDQIPGYPLLRQFVTNYYLVASEEKQGEWNMPYGAKVYTGVYMRLVYHSTAMMGIKPFASMNYDLHKILA